MSRLISSVLLALVVAGCGFTVTKDPPTYEELDPHEKSLVDRVLDQLRAVDSKVQQLSPFDLSDVIDRERINVAFESLIFVGNIGDNQVHISPWENLNSAQRALVGEWFEQTEESAARADYESLFYRFMISMQGVKQYMFAALTSDWLYNSRAGFAIERDAVRATMAYYRNIGENSFNLHIGNICLRIQNQYDEIYGADFSKETFAEKLVDLIDPEAPTGYMYYFCRWVQMGFELQLTFSEELSWIANLPQNNG